MSSISSFLPDTALATFSSVVEPIASKFSAPSPESIDQYTVSANSKIYFTNIGKVVITTSAKIERSINIAGFSYDLDNVIKLF